MCYQEPLPGPLGPTHATTRTSRVRRDPATCWHVLSGVAASQGGLVRERVGGERRAVCAMQGAQSTVDGGEVREVPPSHSRIEQVHFDWKGLVVLYRITIASIRACAGSWNRYQMSTMPSFRYGLCPEYWQIRHLSRNADGTCDLYRVEGDSCRPVQTRPIRYCHTSCCTDVGPSALCAARY